MVLIFENKCFWPQNMKSRRHISAIILLAVFLLRIAVVSLHTHESDNCHNFECEQCAHHQCHSGHLLELHFHEQECLICQLPFVPILILGLTLSFLLSERLWQNICRLRCRLPIRTTCARSAQSLYRTGICLSLMTIQNAASANAPTPQTLDCD